MDWTSKFLTGGCKVFAFHTLDLETRALHQTIGADKSLNSVERHALETWRQLGLPDGLQMDNDAAFCGGYKGRASLVGSSGCVCMSGLSRSSSRPTRQSGMD